VREVSEEGVEVAALVRAEVLEAAPGRPDKRGQLAKLVRREAVVREASDVRAPTKDIAEADELLVAQLAAGEGEDPDVLSEVRVVLEGVENGRARGRVEVEVPVEPDGRDVVPSRVDAREGGEVRKTLGVGGVEEDKVVEDVGDEFRREGASHVCRVRR
jgi:hypothetical protein